VVARPAGASRSVRSHERAGRVLDVLRTKAHACSAYELVATMAAGGDRMAPVQMYRVLGTLMDAGLVLKVESRQGYFAARQPHAPDEPVTLLVCSCCGGVEEAPAPLSASVVAPLKVLKGFRPTGHAIEVLGACGDCDDAYRHARGAR
jgi:Fur family transcriptional regulator, zinc uptake regulator